MSAYPAWTPAPRPGIVPLHPYGFGTTLGRSFTALRHNPAVLLGFALAVQAAAYVLLVVVVGAVAFASFSRLDTVRFGSDAFADVLAGSIALTAIATFVLGLAAGALGVIVQAVVVTEVSWAVVAERRSLGELWRQVRPSAWRLLGYAFLLAAAAVVAIVVVAAVLFGLGTLVLPLAIVSGILTVLAAVPLTLWLNTKLLLVPAVIILEGSGIRAAIARSWRLTRGRFWPTLGVIVTISFAFGLLAQVVGVPLQLVALATDTVTNPTGDAEAGSIVAVLVGGVLTQVVTLLIQCVALIVQSTATALVYVDCRMRAEGLDLDLAVYVERRDAGLPDLADPYRVHVGRARPAPPVPVGPPPGYAAPAVVPPPPYRPPAAAPTFPVSPAPAPAAPAPPLAAPGRTDWTPPGAGAP